MSAGKFKVLKASAGSGKTYALVKEFLLLALANSRTDYYRHILAITFTNASAAEMKERVLKRLHDFANGAEMALSLFGEVSKELNIDAEVLKQKSAAVYRHMLHHYGQLSISTIDSFTHQLVRTFARDLRLAHDFEVQMDTNAFVKQVAEQCIGQIGMDIELTQYLKSIAIEQLESESSWTLIEALEKFIHVMMTEESMEAMRQLKEFSLDDFRSAKGKLHAAQSKLEEQIRTPALAVMKLIADKGLTPSDFYKGGNGNFTTIKAIADGEVPELKPTFHKTIGLEDWSAGKTNASTKELIEELRPLLHQHFSTIATVLTPEQRIRYELRSAVLRNINTMALMTRLESISTELKREQNILLIKDFHELIAEVVSENDAPFIYERIGNRYKHILFDEFQDTSVLQWSNALPLLQNGLSEGNLSLIVGDGKQSIYRWRGGRAEQFVDLPQVNIKGIHGQSSNELAMQYHSEKLENNHRSAKSIIEFNNVLYASLSQRFEYSKRVYNEHRQLQVREQQGLVQLKKMVAPNKDDGTKMMLDAIMNYVQCCLVDGYCGGDIAILTRKGAKEGGLVAARLKEEGIEVVTKESFLLKYSPKVRAVMGFLTHTQNVGNHYAAVDCARALSELYPRFSFHSLVTEHTQRSGSDRKKLKLNLNGWLVEQFQNTIRLVPSGDPFSMATEAIRSFGLHSDTYLEFMLDHIKARCLQGNASLGQLVEWWQTSQDKVYISSSPDKNAVQVMTIHKSKGLQFPVVIYPRFAAKERVNEIWIKTDEQTYGLPVALMMPKKTDEVTAEFFPVEFQKEADKRSLDDLNLCYVATTRAEERLYLLHEIRGNQNAPLTKMIDEVIEKDMAENKIEDGLWQWGEHESVVKGTDIESANIMQHQFVESNHFQVRSSRMLDEGTQSSIEYGNVLHHCFSLIKHSNDLPMAINSTLSNLNATDNNLKEKLTHDVTRITRDDRYQAWFTNFNEVHRERELLLADGRSLRPDRVIVFADRVVVADFKTGAPRAEHKSQVDEYVQALGSLYKTPVVGEVVYITQLMDT